MYHQLNTGDTSARGNSHVIIFNRGGHVSGTHRPED